jgi:hypothetical protein
MAEKVTSNAKGLMFSFDLPAQIWSIEDSKNTKIIPTGAHILLLLAGQVVNNSPWDWILYDHFARIQVVFYMP